MAFNWTDFYKATKDQSHWAIVERAVALLGRTGHALDLGCGAGRDTRYLLAQGWHVTAVDQEASAIAHLATLPQDRLRAVQSSFEAFGYEPDAYDLVSAQFALPFIPNTQFPDVFARIKQAIKPGGVFAGQFFGVRDEWNTPERKMTFVTREQADDLLRDLTVKEFREIENMGNTATGLPKYWHVYHVIAQK